jgi:predicted PurR-regulated permease PerM
MKKISLKTLFAITGCAFLLYLGTHYWQALASFLKNLFSAMMPLFAGFIIAYMLNLVMVAYEKRFFRKAKKPIVAKIRRPICLVLALFTLLAVFTAVIWLVLPQLISCIKLVINLLPNVIGKILDLIEEHHLLSKEIVTALESIDWKARFEQILNMVTNGVTGMVDFLIAALTSVISTVITAFFSIIFAIYLLLGKEKLKKQASTLFQILFPEKITKQIFYVLYNLNVSFRRYLIGQCTEALILGVLCGIGMLILKLPYAAMISALIAFSALIPIAGAYIGAAIGAFMILTVSPIKALIFLIFLLILQQLEGNLIYPRVVGSSLGLPGIWVLAAVTVGGSLGGIPGMFLGVPLVACAYRIIRDFVNTKKKEDSPQNQLEKPTE